MKNSDFVNSPLHATELPVETAAGAVTFEPSPAALPTGAPDALLICTRAELQARWQDRPEFNAANKCWYQLLNHLAAFHFRPELN